MVSYILALFIVLLVTYLAIIFESTSLALLGFTFAVLSLCSFVYLLISSKKVSARLEIPLHIAERNRPFLLKAAVKGSPVFPAAKFRATVCYGEYGSGKKKKIRFMLCARGVEDNVVEYRVTIDTPGNYVFTLKKIRVYDLTGFFYLAKPCVSEAHALVLPVPEAIPVVLGEGVKNFFGDADSFDDLKPGYDPSETFDFREFRAGDRLQSVHWKLSAKADDLVIRENSLPKACPVVCFFAPKAAGQKQQLAATASLSFSLMDAGCPHFAVWNSLAEKDIIRTRVDDEESYYLFLTAFMQDVDYWASRDLAAEYKRKYRGETYLHEITVDGKGIFAIDNETVMCNGSGETELLLR